MTDNIQKLYEIADTKKKYLDFICKNKNCEYKKLSGKFACVNCFNSTRQKIKTYPPFTAEKQLELIKWLLHHKQTTQVELRYFGNSYYVTHCTKSKNKNYEYVRDGKARLFENSIADLFCDMWESLTDNQKQEIKEILE